MNIEGKPWRTIWPLPGGDAVGIIDQTALPHRFATHELRDLEAVAHAIRAMLVRGAPLIGITGAYGLALALRDDPTDRGLESAHAALLATRPTAVNLRWALGRVRAEVAPVPPRDRARTAWDLAGRLADEDAEACRAIGRHGAALLQERYRALGAPERLDVLTHCNAGWLATVDFGTALAPIYAAHDAGLPVHVWVDETRPRNQGASLTAWELGAHGVPHTVIVDNAGGHLMQHGRVGLCIVGSDRTTRAGDVCNKIGTYLKALAAHDNQVPFWVALPTSTLDWRLERGADIPIEERDAAEVHEVHGAGGSVRITPAGSPAANWAFDVTPARLVTGYVTERGVGRGVAGLHALYPDALELAQ